MLGLRPAIPGGKGGSHSTLTMRITSATVIHQRRTYNSANFSEKSARRGVTAVEPYQISVAFTTTKQRKDLFVKNFQQLRRRAGGMLLSALLIAGSLGAVPPTIASAASNLAFRPVADAYVNASKPGVNYGKSSSLRADASPNARSYLRFNVTGLGSSHIQRAFLSIYARSSSSSGLRVSDSSHKCLGRDVRYFQKPAAAGHISG